LTKGLHQSQIVAKKKRDDNAPASGEVVPLGRSREGSALESSIPLFFFSNILPQTCPVALPPYSQCPFHYPGLFATLSEGAFLPTESVCFPPYVFFFFILSRRPSNWRIDRTLWQFDLRKRLLRHFMKVLLSRQLFSQSPHCRVPLPLLEPPPPLDLSREAQVSSKNLGS